MSAWRVVLTDSESLSGVAPVCPQARKPGGPHGRARAVSLDVHGVYDCCPGPHIECWSEGHARLVAHALTAADAEVCS